MTDPRLYQIGTLAALLVYGMGWLDFDITPPACGAHSDDRARYPEDLRSAQRVAGAVCVDGAERAHLGAVAVPAAADQRAALACLAAVIAIAGKFVIRVRGKHVFNPTNGGIVAMLLLTKQVWVSPGQWGTAAFFAFLMACAGSLVVTRAAQGGRHARVHRLLQRAGRRPLAVPRRAADDPAPSSRERRVPALHLLHDLRSEDDARFASRPRAVRGARRRRRVVRAVPAVPDQRPALVAGVLVDGCPDHRPRAAGIAVPVDAAASASAVASPFAAARAA